MLQKMTLVQSLEETVGLTQFQVIQFSTKSKMVAVIVVKLAYQGTNLLSLKLKKMRATKKLPVQQFI